MVRTPFREALETGLMGARPSGIGRVARRAPLPAVFSRAAAGPHVRALAAAAVLLAAVLADGSPARADDLPTLVLRQHRFVPDRIQVPAHVKFQLKVQNTDDSSDEFESVDLNREKLVGPGKTITVFLGPLDPGEYKFFGDFHQDTAQGVLIAK